MKQSLWSPVVVTIVIAASSIATAQDRMGFDAARRNPTPSPFRNDLYGASGGPSSFWVPELQRVIDDFEAQSIGERHVSPAVSQNARPNSSVAVPQAVVRGTVQPLAGLSSEPRHLNDAEAVQDARPTRHIISTRAQDGAWQAVGITSDIDKAKQAVAVLREADLEARVLQYLPLPVEIQDLPLIPGQRAIGVAVNLKGQVYGVTRSGRLVPVSLDSSKDLE